MSASSTFIERNAEKPIWRYMGFSKFVTMLRTESLHFVRLDQLDDKYEGTYPKESNIEQKKRTNSQLQRLAERQLKKVGAWHRSIVSTIVDGDLAWEQKLTRAAYLVSCWCAHNFESHAMWKVYLNQEPGVVIKSTVGRLYSCIKDKANYCHPKKFGIAPVKYYSHGQAVPYKKPHIYKRKFYEYEAEVRAFLVPSLGEGSLPDTPSQIDVPIMVSRLIEEVRVNSTAPNSPLI